MNCLFCLIFSLCLILIHGDEKEPHSILSTPEQISTLTSDSKLLIGNLISPLSGHLSMRKTDLIANGAQHIELKRTYIAPYIPVRFHPKEPMDTYELYKHLNENYRGWVVFPHIYLHTFPANGLTIRFTDPNGVSLDFQIFKNKTILKSSLAGISNSSGETPSGRYDPRNIRITMENNGKNIIVHSPTGSTYHYQFFKSLYLLKKEILPNGKILRYSYDKWWLKKIESFDPQEQYCYSHLNIEGNPLSKKCKFTTSSGQEATYLYEKRSVYGKYQEGNRTLKYTDTSPPFLVSVNSPLQRSESLDYCSRFILSSFNGKDDIFKCLHTDFSDKNSHYRIHKIYFPVDPTENFYPVYELSYVPAITGSKNGTTTVNNSDGTSTKYHISKNFLITSIQDIGQDGKLCREKTFHWDNSHWLKHVELKDGNNQLLYRKTYQYDSFGNPTLETFTGDLSGEDHQETYSIKREFSQDGRNLLLRLEEDNGKVIIYRYLSNTNLITSQLTQHGDQILLREFCVYDTAHNLIRKIKDDGNTPDLHNLSGITQRYITEYSLRQQAPFLHMPEKIEEKCLEGGSERSLKTTHLSYDKYGNIEREDIYDANGQQAYSIHKTYDEAGNLLAEINPLGQLATYKYDEKNRCYYASAFSRKKHREHKFDIRGRLKEQHESGDQIVHTTLYKYDFQDRLIQKTDSYQNISHYAYDPIVNKISKTINPSILSPDNTPLPVSTSSLYNALGFEISKTDANGNTTLYRHNAYGSPIEITHPDGGKEFRRYERNGLLKSQTDPDGLTTHYTYDILGRVLTKTYTSSGQTVAQETFAYNSFHLLSETNKQGYCTSYTYDGAGRKTREIIESRVKEFTYDALGRLETICEHNDEHTRFTTYTRDLFDRILEEVKTDLQGTELYKISYTYDEAGNRKTATRYIHNQDTTETFIYDAFDRLIEHTDALGYQTQTTYNERYQNSLQQYVLQKTITDPLGKTTLITYDALGNKVNEEKRDAHHHPLAAQESFYDPKGSLVLQKDLVYENNTLCAQQITTYSYNHQAQIKHLTRAAGLPLSRTTYYTYTPGGKLATKTLSDNTALSYTYSPLGFVRTITSSEGSIHQIFSYDLLGNLLEASDLIQKTKVNREIDPFGNITNEVCSTGLTLHKIYDNFNRPLTITLADGSQISYSYDACHLKSVQRHAVSGETLYTHSFDHYDLSGRLLAETLPFGLGSTEHTYDAIGRKSTFSSPFLNEKNIYDSLGNLSSRTLNETAQQYSYDGLSQLTHENAPEAQTYHYDSLHNRKGKNSTLTNVNELNEVLAQGDISYKYDLKGNLILKLTSQQAHHLTFDALNRLLDINNDTYKVSFTYDALGRRLSKQVLNKASQGWQECYTEYYLYNNTEELGAFTSPNQPKQLKITGIAKQKNLSSPLVIELNRTPYIALTDTQDNIRQIIDPATHAPAQTYDFTAFGERLDIYVQAPIFNPWCYAGKRLDPEFNLLYFGQRYYDPELGRWLSTDPAGFVNSNNLYQYLLNNPFQYQDPHGESLGGFLLGIGEMVLGGALMITGGVIEIGSFGTLSIGFAIAESTGAALISHGYALAQNNTKDISLEKRSTPPGPDPKAEGHPHTLIELFGPEGKYTTFNEDGTIKQYRGSGKPHGPIPRPNVKENEIDQSPIGPVPGGLKTRPARPDEIPRG